MTHVSFRSIPDNSICAPEHNGDATLVALRLENNYINPLKVSPAAFSCVRSSSSVVLKPQKTKWSGITHDKNKDTLTLLSQTIFCIITKKKILRYIPLTCLVPWCVLLKFNTKQKGKKPSHVWHTGWTRKKTRICLCNYGGCNLSFGNVLCFHILGLTLYTLHKSKILLFSISTTLLCLFYRPTWSNSKVIRHWKGSKPICLIHSKIKLSKLEKQSIQSN